MKKLTSSLMHGFRDCMVSVFIGYSDSSRFSRNVSLRSCVNQFDIISWLVLAIYSLGMTHAVHFEVITIEETQNHCFLCRGRVGRRQNVHPFARLLLRKQMQPGTWPRVRLRRPYLSQQLRPQSRNLQVSRTLNSPIHITVRKRDKNENWLPPIV